MNKQSLHHRRQILWGLMLVGLGTAFLLDRLGQIDIHALWHYWPLLLVASGLTDMLGRPNAGEFSSGFITACIGLWLFACFEGWLGMRFATSWPFLLIAWGLKLVLEALLRPYFADNKETHHEK